MLRQYHWKVDATRVQLNWEFIHQPTAAENRAPLTSETGSKPSVDTRRLSPSILHLFPFTLEPVTPVFISTAAAAPQPTRQEVRLDTECHLAHIKRWPPE